MTKKVLFLLMICFSSSFYSQKLSDDKKQMIDSLMYIVKTTENDTSYIISIESIIKIYKKVSPDSTIVYINKGIEEAKKRNIIKYEGVFLIQKAKYFRTVKENDSAIRYYKLAGNNFLEIKDSTNYYSSKINLANVYKVKGEYEEAINNFIDGIKYYEKFSDDKNQKKALIGKFNLANIYLPLKEFEKAVKLNLELVNHPITKTNKLLYSKTCINLSGTLSKLNRLDEALFYASEAEKLTTSKKSLANIYNNYGTIYDKKEDYYESIKYYKKALTNYELTKSNSGIVKAYNNLGNANTKIEQYDKAEEYLLKSNEMLLSGDGDMNSLQHNYEMLVASNVEQNDFKDAFLYSNELKRIQDSIFGLDMKKALLDVETKYETEKITKEKELAQANELISSQKAENNQKRFIGTAIFAGIISLLLLFIFNRLKLIRKQKKELDEAYELLEESKRYELAASNLKALKSQMNPHFIFNSLNSIQDLIMQQDTDSSYDYIVLFSELVRNTLTYSNNEFIPFHKEIDFLTVYLKLEKLRFGDEFQYTIEGTEIDNIKVPSLIIQPFLENSLKHGLLHKDGLKELSLKFILEEELTCIITDNGVGRTESARIQERRGNKSHESFAMAAITKRLELLSDRFEENFSFEVEDLYEYDIAKGTRITVKIPFEEEF